MGSAWIEDRSQHSAKQALDHSEVPEVLFQHRRSFPPRAMDWGLANRIDDAEASGRRGGARRRGPGSPGNTVAGDVIGSPPTCRRSRRAGNRSARPPTSTPSAPSSVGSD
jgi:hypothetical protein